MERRPRMALLAVAVVVLAAIVGLSGRASTVPTVAARSASDTAAVHQPGTDDHVDRASLPGLRLASLRPAEPRAELAHLPWLALGATALGLLAAAGPAWTVRPAAVHLQRGPARGARRVRGPPRSV